VTGEKGEEGEKEKLRYQPPDLIRSGRHTLWRSGEKGHLSNEKTKKAQKELEQNDILSVNTKL